MSRNPTLLQRTLCSLPGGQAVYRYLTGQSAESQEGMADRWFGVLPAHFGVQQQVFGDVARTVPVWCFDSGATPAAGLGIAVSSDVRGLLTDGQNRLRDRYLKAALDSLNRQGNGLADLTEAPSERLAMVRQAAGRASSAREALAAVNMEDQGTHAVAESEPWRGKIGLILSSGALEHYRPEEVDVELVRMHAVLGSGGILSHVIDHRDHRWHTNPSISPLDHLTRSTAEPDRSTGDAHPYHNRWLRSDWTRKLEEHGFGVQSHTVVHYTSGLTPLKPEALAPEFREAGPDDLNSLVTHFVAWKRE